MLTSLLLLLVAVFLPLAIKLGLVPGKIKAQLKEENRRVQPLLLFSLFYILPIAVVIVVFNYWRNGFMPCMTPQDLEELVRLPLPANFCLSHWYDILFIWAWGLVNLIFFKFYRRLKLEVVFIVVAAVAGLVASYYFRGALYGLTANVLSLTIFRIIYSFISREVEDSGWSPFWRRTRNQFLLIVFLRLAWAEAKMGLDSI
ncbi:MAG TPA: hypothetical protein PKI61_00130 [bacterium]|nr:hypothetical protein [bacterium]HPT29457.1 hypothetical protein [bacterium]